MKEELQSLKEDASAQIAACDMLDGLKPIESSFLGKKGSLTRVLKSLGKLPVEEKKEIGKLSNQVKQEIQALLEKKRDELLDKEAATEKRFDISLPGTQLKKGALHPVTKMLYELNDAFHSLGFEVYQGPEISSELYSFDSLNFPADHPARESMDTYWIAGHESEQGAKRLCLRPHLTGGSVRYMQEKGEPPFRFVYPGRVYRNESTDAGHERAFYQYEALIVDKDVPFNSGQLMVKTILERVFGREVKIRMRSGFFPFVEPGFEIDMNCLGCEGKGCSVCGHSGWVEMMPGGPPHPNVFRAAGVDPEKWQGFYINIGLDRLVMMKHAINDIRLFHSGDLRFLNQF